MGWKKNLKANKTKKQPGELTTKLSHLALHMTSNMLNANQKVNKKGC
jgi:hypothetical protein